MKKIQYLKVPIENACFRNKRKRKKSNYPGDAVAGSRDSARLGRSFNNPGLFLTRPQYFSKLVQLCAEFAWYFFHKFSISELFTFAAVDSRWGSTSQDLRCIFWGILSGYVTGKRHLVFYTQTFSGSSMYRGLWKSLPCIVLTGITHRQTRASETFSCNLPC